MKIRNLIIMSLLAIIISGCSTNEETEVNNDNEADQEENEAEATDAFPVSIEIDGEATEINEKPENILPLSLDVAEIVLELVPPEKIAAITNGIDDPYLSTQAEAGEGIEDRIGSAVNIDPEEIISYDTDLLLLTKMHGQEEDADKVLTQLDIPILSFETMTTVDQFMENTELIGTALGEEAKAAEVISDMEAGITDIQNKIPEDESPSVLVLSEVGPGTGPFMLGPSNISYDLLNLAGATPAVDSVDLEGSTPASIEQILKMDPDYVFLLDFVGTGEDAFSDLMDDPGWNTLEAVEDERVKVVEAKYLMNPNVENVEGLEMIVDWIYDLED